MVKKWLITGCALGTGKGIARAALKQGDQVMLTDCNTHPGTREFKSLRDGDGLCPIRYSLYGRVYTE